MIKRELTGRKRLRMEKRWFGESLLVLQVEVHVTGYSIEYPGTPVDVDMKLWRDATTQDVTVEA